jgi:hypothetical protein
MSVLQPYYGFTGERLVCLGAYDDIEGAFLAADESEESFFFITSKDNWNDIIPDMLVDLNKPKEESES